MRIEALSSLFAVVCLTAVLLCPRLAATNNVTFSRRSPRDHPFRDHITHWTIPLDTSTNKRMTYHEMQMVLREEAGEDGTAVACCPIVEEMIEPLGGQNRQSMYVQLYRDGDNVQRFFEYSCRPDVLDKPCRFVDRKLVNQSRCVQRFTYTYAIVQNIEASRKAGQEEHKRHHHRDHHFPAFPGKNMSGLSWALDYIRVRSGCTCEIMPKPRKKRISLSKKNRRIREESTRT